MLHTQAAAPVVHKEASMPAHSMRLPLALALASLVGACVQSGSRPVEGGASFLPLGSTMQCTSDRPADEVTRRRANATGTDISIEADSAATASPSRQFEDGYVRIAQCVLRGSQAEVETRLVAQARAIGAEKVILHAPGDAGPNGLWQADFHVRFRFSFGASFRELSAAERKSLGSGGVQIGGVIKDSAAARANLLAGDFVTGVNGKRIVDKAAFEQVLRTRVGKALTLTVVRNGETSRRIVRLDALPNAQ